MTYFVKKMPSLSKQLALHIFTMQRKRTWQGWLGWWLGAAREERRALVRSSRGPGNNFLLLWSLSTPFWKCSLRQFNIVILCSPTGVHCWRLQSRNKQLRRCHNHPRSPVQVIAYQQLCVSKQLRRHFWNQIIRKFFSELWKKGSFAVAGT